MRNTKKSILFVFMMVVFLIGILPIIAFAVTIPPSNNPSPSGSGYIYWIRKDYLDSSGNSNGYSKVLFFKNISDFTIRKGDYFTTIVLGGSSDIWQCGGDGKWLESGIFNGPTSTGDYSNSGIKLTANFTVNFTDGSVAYTYNPRPSDTDISNFNFNNNFYISSPSGGATEMQNHQFTVNVKFEIDMTQKYENSFVYPSDPLSDFKNYLNSTIKNSLTVKYNGNIISVNNVNVDESCTKTGESNILNPINLIWPWRTYRVIGTLSFNTTLNSVSSGSDFSISGNYVNNQHIKDNGINYDSATFSDSINLVSVEDDGNQSVILPPDTGDNNDSGAFTIPGYGNLPAAPTMPTFTTSDAGSSTSGSSSISGGIGSIISGGLGFILDLVKWVFGTLIDLIMVPLNLIKQLVQTLVSSVSSLTSVLNPVNALVAIGFGWLPPDIQGLITSFFTIVICFSIFRFVRRLGG